jgi:hypothetical protein
MKSNAVYLCTDCKMKCYCYDCDLLAHAGVKKAYHKRKRIITGKPYKLDVLMDGDNMTFPKTFDWVTIHYRMFAKERTPPSPTGKRARFKAALASCFKSKHKYVRAKRAQRSVRPTENVICGRRGHRGGSRKEEVGGRPPRLSAAEAGSGGVEGAARACSWARASLFLGSLRRRKWATEGAVGRRPPEPPLRSHVAHALGCTWALPTNCSFFCARFALRYGKLIDSTVAKRFSRAWWKGGLKPLQFQVGCSGPCMHIQILDCANVAAMDDNGLSDP